MTKLTKITLAVHGNTINALDNIQPGEEIVYFKGSAITTMEDSQLFAHCYSLYKEGKAEMVQRKLTNETGTNRNIFEYLAIGRYDKTPPRDNNIYYWGKESC